MRRRLPIITPPWWLIAIPATPLVFLLLVLSGSVIWGLWWGVWRSITDVSDLAAEVLAQDIRAMFGCMFAFLFGGFRAAAFHPAFRPRYRQWLLCAPWNARLPLPLGPIHWVWQDLLFVVPATFVAWGPDARYVLSVPIAFVVAYGVTTTVSLFLTNERWIGYVIVLIAGLGVHFRNLADMTGGSLWPTLAITVLSYPLLWIGLRRSLRRIATWDLSRLEQQMSSFLTSERGAIRRESTDQLGWPFDALPLRRKHRAGGLLDEIIIGFLGGWWLYAWHFEDHNLRFLLLVLFTTPFLIAGLFLATCRPPISLWGRLRTGRWIVPGYDRCFIWPAIMCAVQWSWIRLAGDLGVSLPVLSAVQMTLFIWCIFRASTALDAFQLTGAYRIPIPLNLRLNHQLYTNA